MKFDTYLEIIRDEVAKYSTTAVSANLVYEMHKNGVDVEVAIDKVLAHIDQAELLQAQRGMDRVNYGSDTHFSLHNMFKS